MRRIWALCLAATVALGISGGAAKASEGFDDIAKLAKSGIAEEILVTFVQTSPIAYELTVDEILFLNDLGVTSKSIQEIMNHGRDIRAGKAPAAAPADPVIADEPIKPLDEVAVIDHKLEYADPSVEYTTQRIGADPNDLAATPAYFSPLTGQASYTPEVIREKEVVRETVYVPTTIVASEEATTSHFYEALTPYGTWYNINDTWCWQPSVCSSDTNWRPYGTRGHWVWSDCGWCWQSDYSWGWAPFHYGRWWRANGYGWLWTPDNVWGPAWVNWREHDSHWGWAPLPPAARFEHHNTAQVGFHFGGKHWGVNLGVGVDFGLNHNDYCFVPQNRFCDNNLNAYFVSRNDGHNFYRGSRVIQNNITINNVTNNIFVNGPSHVTVQTRTGVQLRQYRINDNRVYGQALTRGTIEDKQNLTLAFYRPRITQGGNDTPVTIASRQLARQNSTIRPAADPRVLVAAARADELRERNFATQDAKRQVSLTRQALEIEEVHARRSDNEQKILTTAIGREQDATRRAEFQKKLDDERAKAQAARLEKESLEKQAAQQRQLAAQLAAERDRVARAKAETESVKAAADTRARLAAERAEREAANKEAALRADKALADQRARIAAAKANAKDDAESRQKAAELEQKAKLDADRAAREANRKAQEAMAEKQKAQLEAERQARLKAIQDKKNDPVRTPPKRTDVTPPVNPNGNTGIVPPDRTNPNTNAANNAAAERAAALKAEREREAAERAAKEAAADKAAADRAAAAKAANERNAAERAAEAKAARDAAAAKDAAADKAAADRAAAIKAQREREAAERAAELKAQRDAAAAKDAAGDKAAADRAAAAKAARDAAAAERAAEMKAQRDAAAAREAAADKAAADRAAAAAKAREDAAKAREERKETREVKPPVQPTQPPPTQPRQPNPVPDGKPNPNDPNDPDNKPKRNRN